MSTRVNTAGLLSATVRARRVPPARSTIVRGIEQVRERRKGMELRIQQLSKHFKDKKAVDEVSFTLTAGVWGLLGANGAGKTTLMRMIADLTAPTSGAVFMTE